MSPLFHLELTELTPLTPHIISIITALVILAYPWQRRHLLAASFYIVVMLFEIGTTVAYILEVSAEVLPAKIFWDEVQWFTLSGAVISVLIFARQLARRSPGFSVQQIGLLSIVPVLYLGSQLIFPVLLPARANVRLIELEPLSTLSYDFTLASLVIGLYLLGLGLCIAVTLLLAIWRAQPKQRGQLLTVLIGITLPVLLGILILAGLRFGTERDVVPASFVFSNLIVTYGLLRYRPFDVAPIARQTIFDSMADPVIVVDDTHHIVDFNPAALRLFNQQVALPDLGRPAGEVFTEWKDWIDARKDRREAYEEEIEVTVEGRWSAWNVSVSPILTREGMLLGWVITLRNITESKLAHRALERYAADLEIARSSAERADRVKSQFLASMSHELRTPLNAIINFNEVVLRGIFGPISPEAADLLTKARNSSRHLLDLINDVLDVSKMQAGALKMNLEAVSDLPAEIERAADLARDMIKDKPVELLIECDERFPVLTCDRRRLRQVLLNLLSNAAKFTREGQITLRARVDGEGLCIEVIDTGPGIPPEHQQAIFEPFVQTEDGRKQVEGTGLGLAISRHLAEAHGGSLTLQSEPGKGAHFTLRLPYQPIPEDKRVTRRLRPAEGE